VFIAEDGRRAVTAQEAARASSEGQKTSVQPVSSAANAHDATLQSRAQGLHRERYASSALRTQVDVKPTCTGAAKGVAVAIRLPVEKRWTAVDLLAYASVSGRGRRACLEKFVVRVPAALAVDEDGFWGR
jgi:hypothetical protein